MKTETVTSVLTELLRLYDLRLEIAKRERATEGEGFTDRDFIDETRRQLLRYGAEKKAAWEAARRVLGSER